MIADEIDCDVVSYCLHRDATQASVKGFVGIVYGYDDVDIHDTYLMCQAKTRMIVDGA